MKTDRMQLIKGDITQLKVDAIVNTANTSLLGGGGVDGAIHRAGGPAILGECRKIGGCPTGNAVITTAGRLPAKFVIHTVGPVWHGGKAGEAKKLADCYRNSLKLATENNCRIIAFPNISTGVYGYPKAEAARIAVETVSHYLAQNELPETVIFLRFDQENFLHLAQYPQVYRVGVDEQRLS